MERDQKYMKETLEKNVKEFMEKTNPNRQQAKYPKYWLDGAKEAGVDLKSMSRKERRKWKRIIWKKEIRSETQKVSKGITSAKNYWSKEARKNEREGKRAHEKVEELKAKVDWSNTEDRAHLKKFMRKEAVCESKVVIMNNRAKHPNSWNKQKGNHSFEKYEKKFENPEASKVSLNPDDIKKVAALMKGTNEQIEIRNEMKIYDLKKLEFINMRGPTSKYWLNDILVDNYLQLIERKYKDVKVFACFVFKKLDACGIATTFRGIRSLMKIFTYRAVLFPIVKNSHWTLVCYLVKEKKILHYDSLSRKENKEIALKVQGLICFTADQMKIHRIIEGITLDNPLIGKQQNGHDCGVFCSQYARSIAKQEQTTFGQKDMIYYRQRMAIELVDGKLLD